MSRDFVDYDPLSGIALYHEYDEGTDTTILHYEQPNLGEHLTFNKAIQNTDAYRADKEFWHAAHIPDIVIMKWKTEYGIDVFDRNDWNKVKQMLNSTEWRHLRTGNFRI
jgi:hypothetical protein